MKFALLSLLFVAVVFAQEAELPLAEICDPDACKLPDCRCSSTEIPGGIAPRDVPQFVTITFDDAINVLNIVTYRNLLFNRVNSANNCPIGTTFYLNHEYTNYQAVNELYNRGFEIALHSITHQTSQTYWRDATVEDMRREFADQVLQLTRFANVPANAVKGVRMPFLQMAGNSTYQMIAEHNFLEYDCSWPTNALTDPALWPYTLHYRSIQECNIPPCPTASIPGPWVFPMVAWTDLEGWPCSMVDACFAFPDREDEDAWFHFINQNFERHYFGNRAPFPFFVHEAYLSAYPAVTRALARFLDLVNSLPDVFVVNSADIIEWVKNPVPIPEYRRRDCKRVVPTICRPINCGPLTGTHNNMQYWMTICSSCPRVYPWLGNPLGT